MSIATYADLVGLLIDFEERSGDAVYAAQIPNFIQMGEASFPRTLRSRRMEVTASLVTAADGTVSLPADYIEPVSLTYADGSLLYPVRTYSAGAIAWMFPIQTGANPYVGSITGNTLALQPQAAKTASLTYLARFTPLSEAAPVNWVLTYHPDLYQAASLYQANLWQKDFPAAAMWKGIQTGLVDEINSKYGIEKFANAGVVLDFVTP